MSVAEDLRTFLLTISGFDTPHISQAFVPTGVSFSDGFVYYARRGTGRNRTFDGLGTLPEEQYFDIEIYANSIDTAEALADALQAKDSWNGDFAANFVGAFFVDNQVDDYIQRAEFTDDYPAHAVFLSVEVHGYEEV